MMLLNAVQAGVSYETKWQELYELDIQNLGDMSGDSDQDIPLLLRNTIAFAYGVIYHPDPVVLTNMVSRQTHGSAGPFDINLFGGDGVECRVPPPPWGVYQLVFTFSQNLFHVGGATINGVPVGSVTFQPGSNQCTVTVSGLTNAQIYKVTFTDITDAVGEHSDTLDTPSWGLLLGDVNSDRIVYSADVMQVRTAIGQTVTLSNFRDDVTVNGTIDNTDVNTVTPYKQTQLP